MIGDIENWYILITCGIGFLCQVAVLILLIGWAWSKIMYRNEDRHFKENVKYSERRKPGDSKESRMEEAGTSSSAT